MANIPLQSITFPDLLNIYNVPTMEGIGKSIFPELIAGGLVDLDSYVENSVPYLFAAMPQGAGKVLTDELVGAKVANNQLIKNGNFADGTTNWSAASTSTVSVSGGVYTGVQTASNGYFAYQTTPLLAHKYYKTITIKAPVGVNVKTNGFFSQTTGTGQFVKLESINSETERTQYLNVSTDDGGLNQQISIANVMCIDLTQMLGSTIADYIYSLEQATTGAGVAFFTKHFGNGYRPYDAGSLQGALVSGHKTIGVNQCNEIPTVGWFLKSDGTINKSSGNDTSAIESFVRCVPNTQYCVSTPNNTHTQNRAYLREYDENKNYLGVQYNDYGTAKKALYTTSANAYYFRVAFYSNTNYNASDFDKFCINLSNADINGKYYPYEEHTYDIEPDDLNGVFVLDNGELKADGDVRRADGSKDVRYGKVNLSDYTFYKSSITTDDGSSVFYTTQIPNISQTIGGGGLLCNKNYVPKNTLYAVNMTDGSIIKGGGAFYMATKSYSTQEDFNQSLSDIELEYELATPTEDTAEPFEEYQACKPYGTEQYILDGSQIVPIPAGHNTKYFEDPLANIMARLDALENA